MGICADCAREIVCCGTDTVITHLCYYNNQPGHLAYEFILPVIRVNRSGWGRRDLRRSGASSRSASSGLGSGCSRAGSHTRSATPCPVRQSDSGGRLGRVGWVGSARHPWGAPSVPCRQSPTAVRGEAVDRDGACRHLHALGPACPHPVCLHQTGGPRRLSPDRLLNRRQPGMRRLRSHPHRRDPAPGAAEVAGSHATAASAAPASPIPKKPPTPHAEPAARRTSS